MSSIGFHPAVKAIMKFKKVARKYYGWMKTPIHMKFEITKINKKLLRRIYKRQSNFWIMEAFLEVISKKNFPILMDRTKALDAFEIRFHLWCWSGLKNGVGFGNKKQLLKRL
jgi:hypothetical protein